MERGRDRDRSVVRIPASIRVLGEFLRDVMKAMRGCPQPVIALEPFRFANGYGLFAVMTRGRYEIEFQGSNDGVNWVAYPFRYKPQDVNRGQRIFAPYQPRFDWNLWFASLGSWRQNEFVTERSTAGDPHGGLAILV